MSSLGAEEFWARGLGKKLRRDLVIAAVIPVEGSLPAKLDEVERLTSLGALPPGQSVDKSTLWRWLERAARQGDWPREFDPAGLIVDLTQPDHAEGDALAQASLLMHARRLAGIISAAAIGDAIGLSEVEVAVKLLRDVPATLLADRALVKRLTERIEAAFTSTLRQTQARKTAIAIEVLRALPPPSLAQNKLSPVAATDTMLTPQAANDLYVTSTIFGTAAAALPQPEQFAIIPSGNAQPQVLQARARAMIVKPIIAGHKTPEQAANSGETESGMRSRHPAMSISTAFRGRCSGAG